jgi:hypothetical protein
MTGKNRIMILRPKGDGAYVVEFRTADGDVLSHLFRQLGDGPHLRIEGQSRAPTLVLVNLRHLGQAG